MKKILLLLFLITSLHSTQLNLTKKDIIVLQKIKSLSDDNMMKYTLMALSIKESSIGKFMINSKSEDYGLFQGNIKTVLSRQKLKDTKINRSIYAQKLINDVGFATANAIIEIEYWRKVHKDNWFKVWASYNTGWKYKSKTGLNYAKSIFSIIKELKYKYKL